MFYDALRVIIMKKVRTTSSVLSVVVQKKIENDFCTQLLVAMVNFLVLMIQIRETGDVLTQG
eukprot:CAMPEP_0168540524 /NCGR_PEP_ID=MMETSP0413-20121227/323_1 /TAXON_ID=136452 /ORGANISM="Filamoeba nolandi, Strain NC-AS-23-1" /LENGTH=61 /DNA_ID=CAMNT_0008570265 /DNA_START=161 /DNA_END=346 /DNA_ORIENTATION=-